MREKSAKKDTALFAHQSSRFDRSGRSPHHDEIVFRLVLKALIQVKLLHEKTLVTQEQCSQYDARQNEAAPYSDGAG